MLISIKICVNEGTSGRNSCSILEQTYRLIHKRGVVHRSANGVSLVSVVLLLLVTLMNSGGIAYDMHLFIILIQSRNSVLLKLLSS